MRWWKVLGAAAFVGVAATGVAIARAERQRRAYTPDQVRDRLRERTAQAAGAAGADGRGGDQEVPAQAGPGWARALPGRVRDRLRALGTRARAGLARGGDRRD
ncbi:hypothetical protein SUDANB121_00681 [Nocardiopsis dassonvillei]|uniref:hypothetical protein n=1 Tax=Nocardiopsis dassonvillei TaxID=2014 RepID=UPI003F579C43